MNVYDFELLVLLIIALISSLKIGNQKTKSIVQVFILSVVCGLRYQETLGSDFSAYKIIFENSIYQVNSEFSYWLINYIVRSLTNNFNILLLLIAFIINGCVVWIVNKYSKMPNLSIIIYFVWGEYFTSFNISRQFIAISLYWISIHYLLSKKNKKALALNILAITFHKSSIIIIIITYFIIFISKNINKRSLIFILLIINFTYFLEPSIRNIVCKFIYGKYITSNFEYGTSFMLYIFELVFIVFIILNLDYDFKRYNNFEKFLITMIIPSFLFVILSMRMVLYARLAIYFCLYKIILITNLIIYKDNKKVKILILYIFIIAIILYFYLHTRNDISVYKNYINDYINII
ncbi:EpsG family protein [Clostridium perfringens]|uniref:EpsG family protein n=1 Tax=Clostridium perfringens TaxID=1502 RepID=UPI0018E43496|nr:EpsG family protein [Clostridium perfringens]